MPEVSKPKRLLGFDYGLKQIGVASGQTLTSSATGLTILKAVDGIRVDFFGGMGDGGSGCQEEYCFEGGFVWDCHD